MMHPAKAFETSGSAFLRFSSGIIFAVALALAPQPAFAQHGGGGGGHGGGGHSAGGPSSGGHSLGGHSGSRGGHSWGGHFIGHILGRQGGHAQRGGVIFRGPIVTQFPQPRRIFPHRRFHDFDDFFGGCFDGMFPGHCGFGTGFFWLGGRLFWDGGYGSDAACDPALGCDGYNGYAGAAPDENYGVQSQGNDSQQSNSPMDNSQPSGAVQQPAILFLKDGSSYGVTSYWLADGNLHYVTNYGGENTISLDQFDWQRTVDENAASGSAFTLKPIIIR
jgi:hypothetical protein